MQGVAGTLIDNKTKSVDEDELKHNISSRSCEAIMQGYEYGISVELISLASTSHYNLDLLNQKTGVSIYWSKWYFFSHLLSCGAFSFHIH